MEFWKEGRDNGADDERLEGYNMVEQQSKFIKDKVSWLRVKKVKGNVHPYHLVDASPWPFFTSIGLLNMVLTGVLYMHSRSLVVVGVGTGRFLILFLMAVGLALFCGWKWCRDVVTEGFIEGHHTSYVQYGLKVGFILFILSEVMFFTAFFWAYFHSSLAPSVELGAVWPPLGIPTFHPRGVPLVNTFTLLVSGSFVTYAHHCIVRRWREAAYYGLLVGILWGIVFEVRQLAEYEHAMFSINDGVYGSLFFMLTGFHGFHVLLGLVGLSICLQRLGAYQFTGNHHVGFEAAAWYWHFVDVVWLLVFVLVYWWGK